MDLNAQDATNLLKLIDRVDLKGNEATPVAILQQKLIALASTGTEVPPAVAPEEKDLDQPTETPAEVVKELKGEKK